MISIERVAMRIKELRKEQGISQLELAKRLGASQPSVANWETGRFWPSSQDLPALAKALNCRHIDDLYPEEVRP